MSIFLFTETVRVMQNSQWSQNDVPLFLRLKHGHVIYLTHAAHESFYPSVLLDQIKTPVWLYVMSTIFSDTLRE